MRMSDVENDHREFPRSGNVLMLLLCYAFDCVC